MLLASRRSSDILPASGSCVPCLITAFTSMTRSAVDFSRALKLRRGVDSDISTAVKSGNAELLQSVVTQVHERLSRKFQKHLSEKYLLAGWNIPASAGAPSLISGSRPAKKPTAKMLEEAAEWLLRELSEGGQPVAATASAEFILRWGPKLSAEMWCQLLCSLCDQQSTLTGHSGYAREATLAAESAFVLSLVLEPLVSVNALQKSAVKALSRCIDEATDTDGMLHSSISREVDLWVAPLVRAANWSKAAGTPWITDEVRERWRLIVARFSALMTPDGPVSGAGTEHCCRVLYHAARLAGFASDSRVGQLAASLNGDKSARRSSQKSKRRAGRFNCQSDWAESAVLRSRMTVDADVMTLGWDEDAAVVHLAVLGSQVLGGTWSSDLRINGKVPEFEPGWSCTCWYNDKDSSFAELELVDSDSVRHVRHVMLSMKHHYAVISESVSVDDEEAEIEYHSSIPLNSYLQPEPDPITRQILLNSDCHSLRLVPAWLDDDRVQPTIGTCRVEDQILHMSATGRGGVTLPLVLDWHPERRIHDADWTRLTVTEERVVMTPRQASGYRVRVGQLQLLLYRSLVQGETLRAVLGHHTANETVYGSVSNEGEIEPLVVVEGVTE